MHSNVITHHSNNYNIDRLLPETDLLIGAVLLPGRKAPKIITKDKLKLMKRGSVVVDVAVDQGGCLETTTPTTHENPIYEVDGIIHYCVANMPGAVPKTSTVALTNSTSSYILELLDTQNILESKNNAILRGVNVYNGQITHKGLAESFNLSYKDI